MRISLLRSLPVLLFCFLEVPRLAAISDFQAHESFVGAKPKGVDLLTRKLSALSPITSEPELQNLALREARIRQTLVDEAVLVLDLDKTALLGSDGNDLGLALQWMEKPESVVRELYSRILSPCIRPMYDSLMQKAKKVHVVIYTRRPSTLVYRSCFRDATLPLQYKREWHHNGQIYFPSEVKSADEVFQTYRGLELLEEEALDVKKALERTLAARDAIVKELDLDQNPPIVVTSTHKDVKSTIRRLGLPVENAFLFDDNADLASCPKVVCVDPLEGLPEPQRSEALAFMERVLPAESLDCDLVDFLMDAKLRERSLERCEATQKLSWRIPMHGHPMPWRTPSLTPSPREEPKPRRASIFAATSSPSFQNSRSERRIGCGVEQQVGSSRIRFVPRRADSQTIIL